MANNGIKIGIVGGGLAGLAAAMKIAEAGHAVDLFSVVPVKRSHSVCAQGGINGAVNTKGEGDSTTESEPVGCVQPCGSKGGPLHDRQDVGGHAYQSRSTSRRRWRAPALRGR